MNDALTEELHTLAATARQRLVEGTALELLAAPGVGGGVDAALGEFAIELGELLAQHAEHHGALARLGLATAAVAEQRRQDQ